MNHRALWYVVSSILILHGCNTKPDTIAVSPDGVNIRFDVRGEGEPTIVFVHGWSNNRSIWDAQVAHFSQKQKVVTIDLPGFGESDNNRKDWTIVSFGEDVKCVADKLCLDRVVLVGLSMGGPVVIEAAKLLSDRVAGIVLVDALLDVEMKLSPEALQHVDSVYMDAVTAPTIEKLKPFFRRNVEASFARARAMLSGGPREGWRESLHETFRWSNEDCIASLKVMQAPIVSINSDQVPTNVEAFQKYVPSFKAKIIPDVGHVVFWDAPEEFDRLLEESIREFMAKSK